MSKMSNASTSGESSSPIANIVEDDEKASSSKAAPVPNESQAVRQRLPRDVRLQALSLAEATKHHVPLHLQCLLDHYENMEQTQAELMLLLIYTIAIESGFVSIVEFNLCRSNIACVRSMSVYHAQNVLKISQIKPTYSYDANKKEFSMTLYSIVDAIFEPRFYNARLKCLETELKCLVTGDLMLVTLTPLTAKEALGRSICLSIPRYVIGTLTEHTSYMHRFLKLNELTILLRDKLFVPIRNSQIEKLGMKLYPALTGLPGELYDFIFKYLTKNQLNIMANVNKRLNFYARHSKYLTLKNPTAEDLRFEFDFEDDAILL